MDNRLRLCATTAVLVAVSVCSTSLLSAQTVRILYDHYVFATGGDAPVTDSGIIDGQGALYAEYAHVGDPAADNYATVRYFADMNKRAVGSYAYCRGSVENFWPYGFTATGRVDKISFELDFDFTVPAGTYAGGVDVSIPGKVGGMLSAGYAANLSSAYYVSWGADIRNSGTIQIGTEEANTIVIDDPFTLTNQIVAPGAILASPAVYRVSLVASIGDNRTSAVRIGTSPNYTTGTASIHMYTGIRFDEPVVPPGVTWETPDSLFMDPPTGANDSPAVYAMARLDQNYPNPFNPYTTISYYLSETCDVRLTIYDATGRLVAELHDGPANEGEHRVTWHGVDKTGAAAASGVYFYRLDVGKWSETRKMILLR